MLDSSDQGPRKQAVVPPSPVSTPIYIQQNLFALLPPFTDKHAYTDTEARAQTQTQPIHIQSRMPFFALLFPCPTDKGTHRYTDTNTDKYRLTNQWIDVYKKKSIQQRCIFGLALTFSHLSWCTNQFARELKHLWSSIASCASPIFFFRVETV